MTPEDLRVALYALTRHMVDHQLPPPAFIDSANADEGVGVYAWIRNIDIPAWLNRGDVTLDRQDVDQRGPYTRVMHRIRLDRDGVQVTLITVTAKDTDHGDR